MPQLYSQGLMETYLSDLQLNWCLIYLNDIIAILKMLKDHLVQLRGVFQKFKEAGLKLKSSKCEFFEKSLTYLSHRFHKGISKLVAVIWKWPTPKTVIEVRNFCRIYKSLLAIYLQACTGHLTFVSSNLRRKCI